MPYGEFQELKRVVNELAGNLDEDTPWAAASSEKRSRC
jgi:hypothetical protein